METSTPPARSRAGQQTALTAAGVARLKPNPDRRLEIPDRLLPGLYLVLQPSGSRGFAVRYRHNGAPRKLTLGPWPTLDLAAARDRARDALREAAAGRDPAGAKVGARVIAAAEQDNTVAVHVENFLARHVRRNLRPRSAIEAERLFRNHVLPRWGRKQIDEITRRDVIALLDHCSDKGLNVGANRVLAAVRKFFNWAEDRAIIAGSPAVRVKPPAAEVSRDRVLSDVELRLVWLAADRLGHPFEPFIKLLVLTAQRRDEIAGIKWDELNAERTLWTVPGSRAKNGAEHDVPLSRAARAVLLKAPQIGPGFVFTTSGTTPVSGFAKLKLRLDALMLAILREEAMRLGEDPEGAQLSPWRLHDLRRTAATGMARLGCAPHVIEAVLNHRRGEISGVAAIYNRHKYLEEKRRALEAWSRHVESLAKDKSPVVVPLVRAS